MVDDANANEQRLDQLVEAVRRLTQSTDQVAVALVEMLRKQDEDRVENKERQKRFDEDQEEFKKRQKRWDEQDWWIRNPWVQPREIAHLFFAVALAASAIAAAVLAWR